MGKNGIRDIEAQTVAAKPDLEAIEARCARASEGPWQVLSEDLVDAAWVNANAEDDDLPVALFDYRDSETNRANAEFAAHARSDVPLLVASLREATRRIEDLIMANNREIAARIEAHKELAALRAEIGRK